VVPVTVPVTVVNRTKWHVDESMLSRMVREHCDSEPSALPESSLSASVAPHETVRLELPLALQGSRCTLRGLAWDCEHTVSRGE
jgi:hypothetical protein